MKKKDCFAATPWLKALPSRTLGLLTLIATLAMTPFSAFATPPTSITLSYDLAKGSLHVEAIHPSFNLDKSYVRLMKVYVNGQEVSSLNYFRQNDYNKFSDDVALTAQVGDVIKVDLFCSLGGEMAQELTVKKAGVLQTDQSVPASTDNSTTNNTANNVTYNTVY